MEKEKRTNIILTGTRVAVYPKRQTSGMMICADIGTVITCNEAQREYLVELDSEHEARLLPQDQLQVLTR